MSNEAVYDPPPAPDKSTDTVMSEERRLTENSILEELLRNGDITVKEEPLITPSLVPALDINVKREPGARTASSSHCIKIEVIDLVDDDDDDDDGGGGGQDHDGDGMAMTSKPHHITDFFTIDLEEDSGGSISPPAFDTKVEENAEAAISPPASDATEEEEIDVVSVGGDPTVFDWRQIQIKVARAMQRQSQQRMAVTANVPSGSRKKQGSMRTTKRSVKHTRVATRAVGRTKCKGKAYCSGRARRRAKMDEEPDPCFKRSKLNSTERQRRIDLRRLEERLRLNVPTTKDNKHADKVEILREASKYCRHLVARDETKEAEKHRLRLRQTDLQRKLSALHTELAAQSMRDRQQIQMKEATTIQRQSRQQMALVADAPSGSRKRQGPTMTTSSSVKCKGKGKAYGSGRGRQRANADEEPDPCEKRLLHNSMERQRRLDLQKLMERLRLIVPATEGNKNAAKVVILHEASKYCRHLVARDETKEAEKHRLRSRQTELQRKLSALHTELAAQSMRDQGQIQMKEATNIQHQCQQQMAVVADASSGSRKTKGSPTTTRSSVKWKSKRNAYGSGRGRRRADADVEPDLCEKRSMHNSTERQLRIDQRKLEEQLRLNVPVTKDNKNAAKMAILHEVSKYCQDLSARDKANVVGKHWLCRQLKMQSIPDQADNCFSEDYFTVEEIKLEPMEVDCDEECQYYREF